MQPVKASVLLEGIWNKAPQELEITKVVTDSREVEPGCVFVAIKGERADGHDFAKKAVEDGAALVLGERQAEGVPSEISVIVPDVLDAMIKMGANYRAQFSPLILAVTGSVGKTTTKEFCSAVFSAFGETLKTEGNQNNEIGLPNTLFRMDDKTEYAVIEMGMQGPGEIRKLTQATRPSGAVITKIGLAHIEQLGSIENVLMAKMEVSEGISSGGPLILNGDDELLRNAKVPEGISVVFAGIDNINSHVRAENIKREAHGQVFEIVDMQYGRYEVFIPTLGRHTVQDALLAYTAATRLGLNAQQAAAALAAYKPAGVRQKLEVVRGVTLLEDFYNAGPDSMKAALSTLSELETSGRRIAVLGDMKELGVVSEDAHKNLGKLAAEAGVNLLITVGRLAALAADNAEHRGLEAARFDNNAEAAEKLMQEAHPGDMVLMKASRGMKFEEILELFKGDGEGEKAAGEAKTAEKPEAAEPKAEKPQ